MNISLKYRGSVISLVIFAAIFTLATLQFYSNAAFAEAGPLDFGEQGAYLALSAASFLTAVTVHPAGNRYVLLWIGLGLAFAALFVGDVAGLDAVWPDYPVTDDIPTLIAWIVTSLALIFALRHPGLTPVARAFLLTGFALQSLAFLADLGDGSLFRMPSQFRNLTLSVDDMCDVLGLGAYLSGLLLISLPLFEPNPTGGTLAVTAGEQAFDWLKSGPARYAAIVAEETRWSLWRLRHPGGDFAAYYAGGIIANLDRGKSHRTLGRHHWTKSIFVKTQGEWSGDAFAERGFEQFEELKSLGITPASTVVDFGCGSLRIGQHFIRHLEPGRFWGLDITDRFYSDGIELVGADVVKAKRPHLHVIADSALQAARRASPDLIYSIAVMKHVPADELEAYWRRVLAMMGPQTTAAVEFQAAARNMRTSGKNWAYTEGSIRDIICRLMPSAVVRLEELDRTGKRPASWRRARLIITRPH